MNYLFSMLLVLLLVPQQQQLPDEFLRLPEEVRAQATVIVTGTYYQGRGPCMFLADGTRRWAITSHFTVKDVFRGDVGGKAVYVKWRPWKPEDRRPKLKVDHKYLVLLRPTEESLKLIKAGEHVPFWDAIEDEEIIAIVELK